MKTTVPAQDKNSTPSKKKRKTATTIDGYTLNVQHTDRVTAYPLPQRIPGGPQTRGTKNQHNRGTFKEEMDTTYAWLVSNTQVQESDGGYFKCWVVDTTATGISLQPSGYARISFYGAYYMVHIFSWLYHHPGHQLQNDASHLCGNKLCIRHVVDETREVNNSRSGCLGYVMNEANEDDHTAIKLCKHNPPCVRVTLYSVDNDVVELGKEQ